VNILVDIGNSRSKYCCADSNNINCLTQITAVDNESFNQCFFERHFINAEKVIVANVSSDLLTSNLKCWCNRRNLAYIEVKSEESRGRVTSAYEKPQQLGVDRWLTLLATAELYPNKSVLIIDVGTATTIDLLDSSGQHLGGWILAGISTLFNSVLKETNKVNATITNDASLAFGSNTSSNVNNACWAATVGLIEQAISQAKEELNQLDEIIITGGNSKEIEKLTSAKLTQIDELIFYGLQSYC